MAVIYSFGDSITYGAWDVSNSGWAERVRQMIDSLQAKNPAYYALFYNLGIPGETTDGLLKRFEAELKARQREDRNEEQIFLFAFGANDAAFLKDEGRFKVPKDQFRKNMEYVLRKALEISSKILVINILPVVERLNIVPRNGKIRLNSYMQEYNAELKSLTDELGIQLVDVNSVFTKNDYEQLFDPDDGLHPNDSGHKLMFSIIGPEIQRLLGWS